MTGTANGRQMRGVPTGNGKRVKHLHQLAHIPRPSDPMGGVRVQLPSQSRDQCVYKQVIEAPDSAGACLRRLILTLEKMHGM